ncbi:MAG: phage holin family protein [Eubacteriales bacterium]|jgi:toxin secretion/phage lysis holin|nr:phage holin family protein [Eubacteriales bacterium]
MNMKNAFRALSGALMGLITWLTQLMGGWDAALSLLFLLMGLDMVTGVITGLMRKSANTPGGGFLSRAFFEGLTRKLMMGLLVILATALDSLLASSVCRLAVIGFYGANEALSIVENAALLGVPFPKGLLEALERFRDSQEEDVKPS